MADIHLVLGSGMEHELFQNRIQKDDLIIGVDHGAYILAKNDYSLDIAIGDFDSVSKDEWGEIHKKSSRIIKVDAEKDATDGELALKYISEHYSDIENIYIYQWLSDGRIDHLLSIFWWVYQEEFHHIIERCYFISHKNEWRCYLPGKHIISKHSSLKYISFICMTPVRDLEITNFKYELAKTQITAPKAFVSNEFLENEGELSFSKGIVIQVNSKD